MNTRSNSDQLPQRIHALGPFVPRASGGASAAAAEGDPEPPDLNVTIRHIAQWLHPGADRPIPPARCRRRLPGEFLLGVRIPDRLGAPSLAGADRFYWSDTLPVPPFS